MKLVYLFSLCLIAGMVCSQLFPIEAIYSYLSFFSDIALAYILMEVGLEFLIDKKRWKSYLWDYCVASTAAALPWIFCFVYLLIRADQSWSETLLISRFAAPTATGILFSMLAAAGLGATWLFHKIRVLAILDDIDTILLMIPLQLFLIGTSYKLLLVVVLVIVLVVLAWRYLHRLRLPSGRIWLLFYAIALTVFLHEIYWRFHLEIEILLPAFVWGCLLYNPHGPQEAKIHVHEHAYLEPEERPFLILDRSIKVVFMFLVGLLLPKLQLETVSISSLIVDIVLLTLLANLGKCFPVFCYRKEASVKERVGVAIGMCPRGEVGAGILILAIEKGIGGYATTVAGLSLALNLLFTGLFIIIVIRLIRDRTKSV